MTSWSSSTASSTPATSANVVFGWSFETTFAFDFPNDITRLPPPWERFMTQIRMPPMRSTGSTIWMIAPSTCPPVCGSAEI